MFWFVSSLYDRGKRVNHKNAVDQQTHGPFSTEEARNRQAAEYVRENQDDYMVSIALLTVVGDEDATLEVGTR